MRKTICKVLESWANKKGNVNSTEELFAWIESLNKSTYVEIKECSLYDNDFWFYDDYMGEILNRKRSFFSIKGMRRFENEKFVSEQPMIFQPEIGYLGIICKEFDGVLNFLMQAKIEPGNVNCVQISPTIQATKSNFMRAHGGKLPYYFEYFEQSQKYEVIYDQIQSEQGSRFYKKRNRNIIIIVNEDIEVHSNFRWMTLGQIKELMSVDNLVNMDTRTVLSGIPLIMSQLSDSEKSYIKSMFSDLGFFESIFSTEPLDSVCSVYQKLNNYKMFQEVVNTPVPLNQLVDWKIDEYGITCLKEAPYMVRYYDISISGREVQHWSQPLFKSNGKAVFGLITKNIDGVTKYLVSVKPELGTFDKAELGPSVQREFISGAGKNDIVSNYFFECLNQKRGILTDVILSEEGGRFYHEQNRNVIIEADAQALSELPPDYLWVDYSGLNYMIQINNCINIQLRNLLSLLKI